MGKYILHIGQGSSKCSSESLMLRKSQGAFLFFGHFSKITVTVTVTMKLSCHQKIICDGAMWLLHHKDHTLL